jgi:tripartite-type tricarboxylate transporter receptor subunit TctC
MKRSAALWAGALLCAWTAAVPAQSLAGRSVRLLVPFGPGGPVDLAARAMAGDLAAELGATVVVENRPGAGGTIAATAVARAAPDGQTLFFSAAAHSINGWLYSRLPYHPVRDFRGAAEVARSAYLLLVSQTVPAADVGALIGYARAHPGALNYTSAGSGSAGHLAMAYLLSLAGVDMVHVPFKSSAEAVNEVLAGRGQATIAAGIGAALHDPRIRAIGYTGQSVSPLFPGLPTVAASGLPGYSFETWFGLLAPAGTPAPLIGLINRAANAATGKAPVQARLAALGLEATQASPQQFDALLHEDYEKMGRIVRLSGARAD